MNQDEHPKSEAELKRAKIMQQFATYWTQGDKEGAVEDAVKNINDFGKSLKKTQAKKTHHKFKPRNIVKNYKGRQILNLERRKSARLSGNKPEFSYRELPLDKDTNYRKGFKNNGPKRTSATRVTRAPLAEIVRPEDITVEMLNNIAKKSVPKTYSSEGKTCHQCRQKTKDTKTICRSGTCVGVGGHFCSICLLNRYGEDVTVALKDPNWKCPRCRHICNCSICRSREGKLPTGILTPQVVERGFKSVSHYLISVENSSKSLTPPQVDKEPGLLGFDSNMEMVFDEKDVHLLGFSEREPVFKDLQHYVPVHKKDCITCRIFVGSKSKHPTWEDL